MPRECARLGLPGDRENVVKLDADHYRVCKFGSSQEDQDNFKLVRSNIKDLYRSALKCGESSAFPVIEQEGAASLDALEERWVRLKSGAAGS